MAIIKVNRNRWCIEFWDESLNQGGSWGSLGLSLKRLEPHRHQFSRVTSHEDHSCSQEIVSRQIIVVLFRRPPLVTGDTISGGSEFRCRLNEQCQCLILLNPLLFVLVCGFVEYMSSRRLTRRATTRPCSSNFAIPRVTFTPHITSLSCQAQMYSHQTNTWPHYSRVS